MLGYVDDLMHWVALCVFVVDAKSQFSGICSCVNLAF